ncbi:hypothetical protein GIB67_032359 [Kingdonia uniflora]|uniref:Uncharacterized protein n=1 Tax=Kingdonia uniflora TaxID=39325 RepID=A0A7J7MIQ5_9MAGN|nr:hypothetical protein GIB67_032359 [Kingdonia uniflora]
MAASGSAYANVIEIFACAAGSSISLVWRPKIKKTVPPSEQTAPVQIPPVGTEGVVADVNMVPPLKKQKKESGKDIRASSKGVNLEAVEQEALDLATCDPTRQGTQIQSSISQLSVAWKSAAEVLKLAIVNRGELVRQHDVEKVEVVHLRGKVIEMEKALSRTRDSINRTQQVHNKLEYERCPHKSNFDKTFKELFELQCRYGKIKIERDEVLRKETDRFVLLQKSLKDKRFVDESDKLECQRSLLSLTLYFEAEIDSERGLNEAYFELLTERGIVPDPARVKFLVQEVRNHHSREAQRCSAQAGVDDKEHDKLAALSASNNKLSAKLQQCSLAVERMTLLNSKLESEMLELQSRLNVVAVELSCKDAEILTANN